MQACGHAADLLALSVLRCAALQLQVRMGDVGLRGLQVHVPKNQYGLVHQHLGLVRPSLSHVV